MGSPVFAFLTRLLPPGESITRKFYTLVVVGKDLFARYQAFVTKPIHVYWLSDKSQVSSKIDISQVRVCGHFPPQGIVCIARDMRL